MSRDVGVTVGNRPVVLYIVGCGRSGSTLLERILGAVPGFVNCGELVGLFSRAALEDQRCGCGRQFSDCVFWRGVGTRAFGGWTVDLTQRVADLQAHVVRQRHVPSLMTPNFARSTFRGALDEYAGIYGELFDAIAEESGARVVVDASKSPAQLMALRRIPGLDVRVLNLVRDPRGVAHSWNKSGVSVPRFEDRQRVMRTYSPPRTALLWSAFQMECGLLNSLSAHSVRIRYEDVVANPRTTITHALTALGLPPQAGWLDHVDERSVTLGASHGVSGSRSRYTTGRVELHLDDDWRSRLAPASRQLVTALTFPQLVGYGYLARPSAGRVAVR